MAGEQRCRECRGLVPNDSPSGLCSKCLLALGLNSSHQADLSTASHEPLDPGAGAQDPDLQIPDPSPCPAGISETNGDRIGRYELLQRLGEGGFGVVYLAQQSEPLRRRVALKIIKLGMDTAEVVARFEAERQALALMDHPNIAKVLDAGATPTGRPFFVMELVQGIRITDYCDNNHLSTDSRLHLFVQVCRAVQHAHQKGIIHRDIKPSNILVTIQDSAPVPKVIDFGIAKATAGQVLGDKAFVTAFEQFLGTPAYMSPEQAEMSALDIDTRSDIYSLGVLLYELLTGKTPFDPRRLFAAGLSEIRRIIREEEPPRPSTRLSTLAADEQTTTAKRRQSNPPQLLHLVRGDLDWIVMKCLDKDRTRRYDSANGLAADVQRYLADEPIEARAPNRLYLLRKLVRRHKLEVAAAVLVFSALAAGLAVSLWSLRKANHEAARSRQVAQVLQDMLAGVGPSVARGRDTTMLREILDKTAQRIDRELKGQPDIEADLRATIGTVYLDLEQYTNAESMHRRALDLRIRSAGRDNPDAASSLNNLGNALRGQGRFAEAESALRQALDLRRKLLGPDHLDVAGTLNNLGTVLWEQARPSEAESVYRQALEIKIKRLGKDDVDVATTLNNLAGLLREEGKLDEAARLHREALRIFKLTLEPADPRIAASLCNLAMVLEDQGKLDQAEELNREALALRQKVLGPNHLEVANSMMSLANVLEDEGKFPEAEQLHRQALEIRQKMLGPEHPDVARSLNNLAVVLAAQGRSAEAEKLFRESLAMKRKLLGPDHPSVANSLAGLASLLMARGQLGEAEELCRQEVALARKSSDPDNPTLPDALADLAQTLLLETKFLEAESLARECLTIREKRAPDDWSTFDASSLLGATLLGQSNYVAAEPLLLSSYQGLKRHAQEIPAPEKRRLTDTLQCLAQLYQAVGKPDEAAKWKKEFPP